MQSIRSVSTQSCSWKITKIESIQQTKSARSDTHADTRRSVEYIIPHASDSVVSAFDSLALVIRTLISHIDSKERHVQQMKRNHSTASLLVPLLRTPGSNAPHSWLHCFASLQVPMSLLDVPKGDEIASRFFEMTY